MLSILVAFSKNYVIGRDNKLIWYIPKDLKRFKDLTTGKTIIMGRKTFESLPKVLPDRQHIIVTRDTSFNIENDKVMVINNIEDIIKLKDTEEEYFVIGGGEVYKTLLPYCKRLYLTVIDSEFKGDTYFPEIDFNRYIIEEEEIETTENGLKYSFINLMLKD